MNNPVVSPMQPVAPPAKKIRASGDVSNIGRDHDTVKKRREELDRLKEKQQKRSTTDVSSRASVGIRGPRGPPRAAPPPPRIAANSNNAPPLGPPKQAASPLARRLDPSFARGRSPIPPASRARSAPPTRPPPPPGPPPTAKEAPESTPSKPLAPAAPPTPTRERSPGRAPRGFAARPPPTTPGAKLKAKGTPGAPPVMPVTTPRPKPPSPLVNRPVVAAPQPPSMASPPVINFGKPDDAKSDIPTTNDGPPPRAPSPTLAKAPPATAGGPPKALMNVSTKPADAPPQAASPVVASLALKSTEAPPRAPSPTVIKDTTTKPEYQNDMGGPPTSTPEVVLGLGGTPAKLEPDPLPIQSRRNMIKSLALGADTPAKAAPLQDNSTKSDSSSVAPPESSLLRLEKEVREHEKAKAEALRRVALLEEQLQKFKEKGDSSADTLGTLISIAESEGDAAALQWARASASGVTPRAMPQASFFSPMSPPMATPRSGSHKRAPTPRPKLDKSSSNEPLEVDLFSEAVKCTPFEFATDLATFIVRRPHGIATEQELWFTSGYLNAKKYERTADVRKPYTLELVAFIGADSSTLTLSSNSDVRHHSADADDWREFSSVQQTGKELGTVTYIDTDAVEKDYSLDEVYEGALSARETYCTSVLSMVLGLKARGPMQMPINAPNPSPEPAKEPVQTAEVGVNTDDLPMPEPKSEASKAPPVVDTGVPQQQQAPQTNPKPQPDDFDDGPDTATLMLGAFVSLLLWSGKTVCLTLPMKILQSLIALLLFCLLVSLLSLQIEENPMGPVYYSRSAL